MASSCFVSVLVAMECIFLVFLQLRMNQEIDMSYQNDVLSQFEMSMY